MFNEPPDITNAKTNKKDVYGVIKNRQRLIFKGFLIATICMIIALFVFIFWIEDIDLKPAGTLLSLFLSIMFLIITIIFYKRSRAIEKALENNEYLARWHFDKEKWEEFVNREYNYRKAQRKALFVFLSVITVIIFSVFILVIDEAQLPMFLTMVGLVLMYAFLAFLAPFLSKCYHKKGEAEVLIMKNGILLNKQLHIWNVPTSKFKHAEFKEKPFPMITITYSFYDRTGPREYTVVSPVPNEREGRKVVEQLKENGRIDR